MKWSEKNRPSSFSLREDEARRETIGFLDLYEAGEADLSRPQYDSRKVHPGDAFFAIRGFETDGHRFISRAIANGARTIVLDDDTAFSRADAERGNVSRVLVSNSRRALAFASEWAFGSPSEKLRMIGVTGTNGKTTVTHLMRQLLILAGHKTGLIGTIGNWIDDQQIPSTHTTPESRDISELLAQMVAENVTHCVMEVSSHALALDRVTALDFDIAVFTNLTRDHLDFHKTMDAYFEAKKKLFDVLKDTAIAITNGDDQNGMAIVKDSIANIHSYGIRDGAAHADLIAFDIDLMAQGTKFTVEKRYSSERAVFASPLIGTINVENVLAAASALYFGVEGFSLEKLAEFVPNLQAPRGRFERIVLRNGAIAIVDYAHTPDALENILKAIRAIVPKEKKIITVFGCGGDRDKGKRPRMGRIAANHSDFVIITSDNPRSENPMAIIDEIARGIENLEKKNVEIEPDRAKAIKMGLGMANSGDIVLLAGKGHENYQIFGDERRHFDDREEVLKYNSKP